MLNNGNLLAPATRILENDILRFLVRTCGLTITEGKRKSMGPQKNIVGDPCYENHTVEKVHGNNSANTIAFARQDLRFMRVSMQD